MTCLDIQPTSSRKEIAFSPTFPFNALTVSCWQWSRTDVLIFTAPSWHCLELHRSSLCNTVHVCLEKSVLTSKQKSFTLRERSNTIVLLLGKNMKFFISNSVIMATTCCNLYDLHDCSVYKHVIPVTDTQHVNHTFLHHRVNTVCVCVCARMQGRERERGHN